MRMEDDVFLEEFAFEEAMDQTFVPELRRYFADDADDDEPGMRALIENPEALGKSLRRELS